MSLQVRGVEVARASRGCSTPKKYCGAFKKQYRGFTNSYIATVSYTPNRPQSDKIRNIIGPCLEDPLLHKFVFDPCFEQFLLNERNYIKQAVLYKRAVFIYIYIYMYT